MQGAGKVPLARDIGSFCYSSLNTIPVIKLRRIRLAGHTARMGEWRGIYIRGVTGGTDQTSGGCSLCYTIPI